MTVNKVIAFNLTRARRRAGWTQEEAAERLTAACGRRWTKATVGAAERSWEIDRTREFDGDELVAFSLVFGQPLAFWFLPPDVAGKEEEFTAGAEGRVVSHLDLLSLALPLRPSSEFVDAVNAGLRKHDLSWSPSRPRWYRLEEELGADAEEGHEPTGGMPSADAVLDDAKRQRVLELLEELRRLVAPDEFPPF